MNDVRTQRSLGQRVLIIAAVLVAIGVVAWIIGGRQAPEGNAQAVGESVIEEYPPGDRAGQTPFSAKMLSGQSFESTSLAGEVAVYNVWGSWCVPCVKEAPDLVEVANEFGDEVTFVGINVRDNDAAARAFERKHDIPYDSVTSADSAKAMLSFKGALAGSAVPTTVIVDRDGTVAARVVGPVTASTLRALLDAVLAERADAG